MELRESGMPEEAVWDTFFDSDQTLQALGLTSIDDDVVDLCAGYGTFTIAAARRTTGRVHAFDIQAAMVERTRRSAELLGLRNVWGHVRDVAEEGTGLPEASVGYAMLFNILHCECPHQLLDEAFRILRTGGLLGVTHWVSDRPTPRGPSADIRPTPKQCSEWALACGFERGSEEIALPPHHFGLVFVRP